MSICIERAYVNT